MRELLRKKRDSFLGRAWRRWVCACCWSYIFRRSSTIPASTPTSRQNWLQHGVYGITNSGVITPTLARLPGYPAFLAVIFALFGVGNFRAVLLVQVLFDLATCFLIADLARRLFS